MTESSVFTYQTRLDLSPEQLLALDALCDLHSRLERKLYAMQKAENLTRNELKRYFIEHFGISARMFNSIAISIDGKKQSIKELLTRSISETKVRMGKMRIKITNLKKRKSLSQKQLFSLHQYQRKLAILMSKLSDFEKQKEIKSYAICFGTRKLFHAQYHLEANGYQNHEEWQADWRASRANQCFFVGSKDESAGNMLCQLKQVDGHFSLQLRLPDSLNLGKYLHITALDFAYGKDNILAAINSCVRVERADGDMRKGKQRIGNALTYRFVRDQAGYRLFVSTNVIAPKRISNRNCGAIGVDLNSDHLAVSQIDHRGNWISSSQLPLHLHHKTSRQAGAIIGDQVKVLVELAKNTCRPIVMEQLDFSKKKAALSKSNPDYARMLSSLAYNKIIQTIKAACFRAGIEVIEVNPAFTSTIGAVNYAQAHGLSIHQAAAIAIARRGLGFSENPTKRVVFVPTRNGSHVTFPLPARNHRKHVWSHWSDIRKSLIAAQKAHTQSGNLPAPLSSMKNLSSANCVSGMQMPRVSQGLLLPDVDQIIPF